MNGYSYCVPPTSEAEEEMSMTEPFRKILNPVDFDENSLATLVYAGQLARQNEGTVYLMHVVPTEKIYLLREVYRPEEGGGADPLWAEKVAQEKLQEIARERLGGVRCEILMRGSDDPAKTILETERKLGADLVVMATHGRTGFFHLVLGSVAEKVVRESSCPVLTIRRREEPSMVGPFGKILSPVDFDENSLAALDLVRQFAQQNNGTVYLLHVVPTDEIHLHREVYRPEEGGGADPVWAEKVTKEKLQRIAHERLSDGIRCQILTRIGDAAKTILEVEREVGADLVVMATHGRTGISHFILGSVAERMVRESSCPVLTIRRR